MPKSQTIRRSRTETSRVGKRGAVVVPARLRRKFGIEEGALVIAEEREDGVLIRPAVTLPVEVYTPARTAEFPLSIAAEATHLLTGDKTHFGRYYGQRLAGVLVLPPAQYLQQHRPR